MSAPGAEGGSDDAFSSALTRAGQILATNPRQAEELLRGLAHSRPDELAAQVLLSRAFRAQLKTRRAVSLLQSSIARHPHHAPLHYELALVRSERGETAQAIAGFRRALSLDGRLANGWLVLGDLLFAMGDRVGADEAYMRHIDWAAGTLSIRAWMIAAKKHSYRQAEKILRRQLARLPTDLAALAVLGETLGRLDDQEEAAYVLGLCVDRIPSFEKARFNYATMLCRLIRPDEALVQLDRLLERRPNERKYLGLKAAALNLAGRSAEAVALYETLNADFPRDAKTWTAFGHALRSDGRHQDAVRAYRRSAALNPKFGAAYWGIANLKTAQFSETEIAALRKILDGDEVSGEQRLHCCFALGKALEDIGDYERSFAYYAQGNALRRAELPYSPDENARRLRELSEVFTAEMLSTRRGVGAAHPDPIFIVGLPRSGSTLIEQILDCHSNVEGTAELPDLGTVIRDLTGNPWEPCGVVYPKGLPTLERITFRRLGEDYVSRTRRARKTDKPLFTDKMLSNFEQIGLIHLILPNAKVIDTRRHPLGCCFSNFKQFYSNGQRFTYDLTALGRYYSDYVQLMAHFDRALPGRVHRIFHENVVADPEGEVRKLLHFCGLAFEPACLRFHENPRQVRTVSSEQVRRPIFADGVDLWRNYEPWLGALKEALGPVLDAYPAVPPVLHANAI